ncbi:MAG: GNAT family N-acetyltransferase, partial [Clostridium sp.]
MALSFLRLQDAEKWDVLVHSFSSYDVYYLSAYVKAFQLHGDGEPLLFYYEDENLRGIHVVMWRDIATDPHFVGQLPENTYFDFATPYGYGGWIIEGKGNHASLYAAYQNWCHEHDIISEFLRFHPVLENHVAVQD